jgi:hypothetical protein
MLCSLCPFAWLNVLLAKLCPHPLQPLQDVAQRVTTVVEARGGILVFISLLRVPHHELAQAAIRALAGGAVFSNVVRCTFCMEVQCAFAWSGYFDTLLRLAVCLPAYFHVAPAEKVSELEEWIDQVPKLRL